MQAQMQLLYWQLWLDYFPFSIKHIQGLKNSLTDNLTTKLSGGDHQSRTPAEKGEKL